MRSPSNFRFRAQRAALLILVALLASTAAHGQAALPAPADAPQPSSVPVVFDDDPIPAPRFGAGVRLASQYVFLGRDVSQGHSVVQPWLEVDHERFGVVVWANEQADRNMPSEVRVSFQYAAPLGAADAAAGYTYRRFPHHGGLPTQELFVSLVRQRDGLVPSLSIHYDFGAGRGLYADLGLDRPIASHLALGSHLYAQNGYFGASGIPAAELHATAALPFGAVTLSPTLSRLVTWTNGDFSGARSVDAGWLFTLDVAR